MRRASERELALPDPARWGRLYQAALTFATLESSPRAAALLARLDASGPAPKAAARRRGRPVCLDYAQAALEAEFILRRASLRGARVLEIGAGYGRTCHVLLSNVPIAAYTIVETRRGLARCRAYLRRALPARLFARVELVAAERRGVLAGRTFELGLLVDSMAELAEDTRYGYRALVDASCRTFYVKNPATAWLTGPSDARVYDGDLARAHRGRFLRDFRPGARWRSVADGWARPWPHFWQAFYRRAAFQPKAREAAR